MNVPTWQDVTVLALLTVMAASCKLNGQCVTWVDGWFGSLSQRQAVMEEMRQGR